MNDGLLAGFLFGILLGVIVSVPVCAHDNYKSLGQGTIMGLERFSPCSDAGVQVVYVHARKYLCDSKSWELVDP